MHYAFGGFLSFDISPKQLLARERMLMILRGTVHDPDYRASLADFTSFIEKLTEKIIEIDDTVPELPMKDVVRRS